MKYKFSKPFSTLKNGYDYFHKKTLKELWIDALHDPGYLFMLVVDITFLIVLFNFLVKHSK